MVSVHDGRGLGYQRRKIHPVQNVGSKICARRDFKQDKAVGREPENRAFGDVEDILFPAHGLQAGKGDLFHVPDKLPDCAMAG